MNVVHLVKDRTKGCPWKKKCDDCNLYQAMYKHGPHGEVTQEWNCAVVNSTILLSELKSNVTGVQSATESFRNEVARMNGINLIENLQS